MYFFFKDNKLCCYYKNFLVSDLGVKLEFRGQHHNMLDEKNGVWTIEKNGQLAKSIVENVGTFELRVSKADGGLILQANLRTAKEFEARKCYRLYVTGFLPIRISSVLFNNPQAIGL